MKKKKGYVLVYSVIAMLLTCALVLSTVTIILYYGNNVNRTVGGNGALYVADSGISSETLVKRFNEIVRGGTKE